MQSDNNSRPCFTGFRLAFLVALIFAVVYVIAALFQDNGLRRVDGLELILRVQRWKDAGSPQGDGLTRFMAPRDSSIVESNRSFVIDGTNYSTLFARTNVKHHVNGALFVTTNEVLIFLYPSGEHTLLSDKRLPR